MSSSSSSFTYQCLMLCLFLAVTLSQESHSSNPKSIVLKVSKDLDSLQHIVTMRQGTPPSPLKLVVDLGGESLWVDCQRGNKSSSYVQPECPSELCSSARARCGGCFLSPKFACHDHKCGRFLDNSVRTHAFYGIVGKDVISVESAGSDVQVQGTVFICGETAALDGLAKGVKGMVGFGRTNISMITQFTATLKFQRKFSICLSPSSRSNGVLIIGDRPQHSAKSMTFTPLIVNPESTASAFFPGESSAEYFIGVKAILINKKQVPIDESLLKIANNGRGGTKISSVEPYTMMQTSIFRAVIETFMAGIDGSARVAEFKPFGACFDSNRIKRGRSGPHVPEIDLVLQNDGALWRIRGANSMVEINESVTCLGLVDGGMYPAGPSIVIGGHQLEDNLLEFDLVKSVLGFGFPGCSKLNLA